MKSAVSVVRGARASILCLLLVVSGGAVAQGIAQSGWASEDNIVAKRLIEQERKWAALACMPQSALAAGTSFLDAFIADDFVGTHPKGTLYSKSDMMALPAKWEPERDCKLLSAKVRFIEPNVAVIYGRESAVAKDTDGKYATRTLVWTDTLLLRARKWQVIAVQDMAMPSK